MISFKPPLPAARVAQALAEVQLILVPTGVKAVAGLSGASRKKRSLAGRCCVLSLGTERLEVRASGD